MSSKPMFAIIGAMDAEIEEYLRHIEDEKIHLWHDFTFYEGRLYSHPVVVVKSGIGKVFAAMITQHLIDCYTPTHVIFTGVAGALNPGYEIGDVVLSSDCVQHDMDVSTLGFERGRIPYTDYQFFSADPTLIDLAKQAEVNHPIHIGRILTGDQFFTQKKLRETAYLTQELKGDAIKMEGAAVGQVCALNKIPFLIVRTISDKADEQAPVNFTEFLPEIARNSYSIVDYILSQAHQLKV